MAPEPKSQSVCDLLRTEIRARWKLPHAERAVRAKQLVCKYVPDGLSLADELIADRRREVEAD